MNLELEENEGIIGDKPNFDQDRDWKAKGGISAGLFTLNSRPKAIRDHPFKTSAIFHTFLTPTPLPSAVF